MESKIEPNFHRRRTSSIPYLESPSRVKKKKQSIEALKIAFRSVALRPLSETSNIRFPVPNPVQKPRSKENRVTRVFDLRKSQNPRGVTGKSSEISSFEPKSRDRVSSPFQAAPNPLNVTSAHPASKTLLARKANETRLVKQTLRRKNHFEKNSSNAGSLEIEEFTLRDKACSPSRIKEKEPPFELSMKMFSAQVISAA